ncbi:MAG: type I pullulanase, partial [Bacilli bacterium]|nr:type I pullulanase [Bacilli bacterium]
YEGELGAKVHDERTDFALWAPLASKVSLKLKRPKEDSYSLYPMKRGKNGEYTISFPENLDGSYYLYQIVNSEVLRETTDPYAKGSTLNSKESVVIDFKKLKQSFHREDLPTLTSPTDAIIYEGHVRDLTIDSHTDIVQKGRFLGLCEAGRTTEQGHPAGFDYLKYLGITHLQLLPIYDYQTVDEAHPDSGYNWGYDPRQYFVPEGSYASDLQDPYSRIKDLKTLVASYHEAGIRIVMDVVFNHVYESSQSVFEACVPNYYFRRRGSGKLATTSGCGNDLASERPMVRKMILDCCRHWIEEYGIDGFRFDLMGLLDVETLLRIERLAKAKVPDFLLYGEGWNMGGELKMPQGRMENALLLPGFGFFNDAFRECAKNYFAGDEDSKQGFKACYVGSCLDFIMPKKFLDARQSINYVECHDNATFFDFLQKRRPDLPEEELLEICQAALASVLLSRGVPFLHMGQEIGQSKWGEENTYNKGDHYNKFSYALLDLRFEMAEYAKMMIEVRRNAHALHIYEPSIIDESVDLQDIGALVYVHSLDEKLIRPYKEIYEFYNPTDEDIYFPKPLRPGVTLSKKGYLPNVVEETSPSVLIPKRSVVIHLAK